VPSGIAAVMLATIPVFMALAEILFLRTQSLTLRLGLALLIGIGGVAVLVTRSASLGEGAIDKSGSDCPYRCRNQLVAGCKVLPASCHCPNRR